jgi:hypothetical protein
LSDRAETLDQAQSQRVEQFGGRVLRQRHTGTRIDNGTQ